MSGIAPVWGLPGMRTAKTATHRIVFRQGDWLSDLSQGKIIDGTKSRDSGNTGDLDVLRPGMPMGKITSSGKYAPSIMGLTNAAYSAGGTTLTLTAAAATELARRVGSTGTFRLVGPPAASGVVAEEAVTYSAVNTSTGAVTITALANSFISGSLVMPDDGSEDMLTIIPDGYGVKVTDNDGTSLDVPFAQFPIAGVIVSSQLLFYPSDASLKDWYKSQLALATGGKFIFDDEF